MMYMHHMKPRYAPDTDSAAVLTAEAITQVCLCHHVRRTARAITRLFDEALGPVGVKASQFNILAVIGARESCTASEACRALAMDRTTLSRNLKPLREAGYITAEGGAGRRPDALALTVTGQDLLTRAAPLWRAAQTGLSQRLGTGQTGALLQGLEAATRVAAG